MTKKYLIDEEELNKLVGNCFKNSETPPEYDYVDEIIHDKYEVEEIASGEISHNNWGNYYIVDDNHDYKIRIYTDEITGNEHKILYPLIKKQIKIFIEVVK